MKIIAITGGIGAGKSTVRKMFEEQGAVGIDADDLARQVVLPGSRGAWQLQEAFGPRFFDHEGNLDRKLMAKEVFGNPASLRTLESILHPLIREAEKTFLERLSVQDPGAVIAVEIPLLAEVGRARDYDFVVLVTAPESLRISRLVEAGAYSYDDAAARIASQADDEEREKLADWVVDNGGDPEETKKQVQNIFKVLGQS